MRIRWDLIAILSVGFVFGLVTEVQSQCNFKFCQNRAGNGAPTRVYTRDTWGRTTGDIYDPGHGRRLQVRDGKRRIIGYIDRNNDDGSALHGGTDQ